VEFISGNFFSALGVSPAAGRLIREADDKAGAARALGHRETARKFYETPSGW